MAVTLQIARPPQAPDEFTRADLQFRGIDHSGPSFQARVFIENPDAKPSTPLTEEGGHLAENRWSSFHGAGEECRNACPISRRAFVASPSEIRHRGDVWV